MNLINKLFFVVMMGAMQAGLLTFSVQAQSLPDEGLVLWLRPEALENRSGTLARWRDLSPGGNHAVQSEPLRYPVVQDHQLNGYPVVSFQKAGQRLRLPQLNLPYETTVFIVAFDQPQKKTNSVHHSILAADNSPYRMDGNGYGIGYAAGEYDGAMVILSDGKIWQHLRDLYTQFSRNTWEVMTFTKRGQDVALMRDGFLREARTFDRPEEAGFHTGYLLGGDVNGRDYSGGIAEVIAYSRGLSPDEVDRVHKYLSLKYDIPIADGNRLTSGDPRFFHNGTLIYKNTYADQPYIVKRSETEWVAVVTFSAISENSSDRHMKILRSMDAGKTWAEASVLEPIEEMRQPSWGTLLAAPDGRLFCFYNLNRLSQEGRGVLFVYRFSDDGGLSWSERYTLPVRETWHNKQFNSFSSWGIDPPLVVGDTVYISFSKYGPNASGRQGEGFFFKSDTLFSATDPEEIRWEMLPEGDHGLVSARVGTLQEEHNIESLGGNDLYCAFRTKEGYVGEAYSRDGAVTWTEPDFARYANGRKIKNTRSCCMVWRCENGNYLLWFHNNDGRQTAERNKDRNPAWLSGGILKEGRIVWSQPEPAVFTFAPAHNSGMSYPDLTEQDGKYFISATDKEAARLCEIDAELLSNLWSQETLQGIPQKGLVENLSAGFVPDLDDGGFSITCSGGLPAAGVIWSAQDTKGNGAVLKRTQDAKVAIEFKDRFMALPHTWETDEPVQDDSTVTFILDGAANWIYVVVDGVLCDGGEARQFGWGPIPYQMKKLTELPVVPVSQAGRALLHDRILSVSETIGLHRALAE